VYRKGKQDERQEALVELYEVRLGRPLDEGEKAALLQRLGSLGRHRLMKVGVEMSPEALAAWLGNPQAA
jgi:hypothetical protein